MRLNTRSAVSGLIGILVLIQLVPVPKTNPPSDPGAAFRSTRPPSDPVVAILNRSCRDCHSNDTIWPWYSHLAPVSWLLYRDVTSGRRHMNLSEFAHDDAARQQRRLGDICEQVKSGDMPPWFYLPMHPDARLRPGDVDTLCSPAQRRTGE
jgi:hypothetical protein